MSAPAEKPPVRFGVVIFPGFQALDVFGPVDTLNNFSQEIAPLEFALFAVTLDPVTTKFSKPGHIGQSVVPTHTFDECPEDLEVLLVPGGFGSRDPAVTAPIVKFLERATSQGPNVQWVRQARWVVDGNIWTSSGVSAGMDLMYAFIKDQYGEETAKRLADKAEYVRNPDSNVDPFA